MKKFNVEIELSDDEVDFLKNINFSYFGIEKRPYVDNDLSGTFAGLVDKNLFFYDCQGEGYFVSKYAMEIIQQIKKDEKKLIFNDTALDYLIKMKTEVQEALNSKRI
jgi:hypothetical protein